MIVDGHNHLRREQDLAVFRQVAARVPLEGFNVLAEAGPAHADGLALGFIAKHREPGLAYCFGCLDHTALFSRGAAAAPALAAQVRTLAAIGMDGLKLIESKPDTRKSMGEPLDGSYYAEAFAALEALDLPVLWHVADPPEFWDPARTPAWARQRGWGYDTTFPSFETLHAEAGRVLDRHPRLRVIFAHFMFLSHDLDRAARFLADHPRVSLDLAPGIELFYNLSRDRERSRAFFMRHADRILFGTDAGLIAGDAAVRVEARIRLVWRFLETGDDYRVPPEADFLLGPPEDGVIRGLALPKDVLRRIGSGNFRALAGARPRPLDRRAAAAECRRLAVASRAAGGSPATWQVAVDAAAELA